MREIKQFRIEQLIFPGGGGNRANLLIISVEVNRKTTSVPSEVYLISHPKVLAPQVLELCFS
jgi:hypothetical protein